MKRKIKENKLLIIFMCLLVLVIGLGIRIFFLEKNKSKVEQTRVDMVVPIIKNNTNYSYMVTFNNIKKDKKIIYTFKITNYRNKSINSKEVSYDLSIKHDNNLDIKIYKDEKAIQIETKNNKLKKESKDTQIYKLIINPKKDEKHSTINVNINS